jgi:hypothetical protein
VGGEWSYAQGGLAPLTGTNEGLASSGYVNANTNMGNLNGLNLSPPAALDGINFGIAPAGYANGQGNGGINSTALILGGTTFTITVPSGLSVANNIGNVFFTYGTSCCGGDEPNFPGVPGQPVPEPNSLLLLGTGLSGMAFWLRSKARKQ